MGDLPKCRIEQNPVFLHVGIDYAGPFIIRMHRVRRSIELKVYIAVYVCMVTKAIHLEIVESLSTDEFLATFTRFIATRGLPTDVYSDQGTNFVGADNYIQKLFQDIFEDKRYINFMLERKIKWHFNPAASPHFGGLWESNVKCVKQHLKSVTGEHKLTLMEFHTLLKSIEACLNSRPLCALSDDVEDYDPLTPGHFLIGRPLLTLPHRDYTLLKLNRLKIHDLLKRLNEDFWRRWKTDYLCTLQHRRKWTDISDNLKLNDLVVISDQQTAPTVWPMGRIVSVYPDEKGMVRVVDVQTAKGTYKRAIHKLVKLPDPVNYQVEEVTSTGAEMHTHGTH